MTQAASQWGGVGPLAAPEGPIEVGLKKLPSASRKTMKYPSLKIRRNPILDL
jgi:hypothetical protein